MSLRSAVARDGDFLWRILLEAYNWNGEQRFTAEQLSAEPHTARYLVGCPCRDDVGVIAQTDAGEPIGAVWARRLPESEPGYGFVGPDVPELTLGLLPGHRGRGHGRGLMEALIQAAAEDFDPCSYGFRPNRRAHDAIAEIRTFAGAPHRYEWVVEGDIAACFDEISHAGLMDRVRQRITDKRVLMLVKAFLKSGILNREGIFRDTHTGTPQGGILSPLLANIALSVLDEHFAQRHREQRLLPRRERRGQPSFRLVRYADDWVALVRGNRADAEAIRDEAAEVLSPMGLRLSEEKTTVVHIDDGFDFLGWRIQRHRKRGTAKQYVYTYPSKKAVKSVTGKVKAISRLDKNLPLEVLLHRLNSVLRGWCLYFQPGVSSATFRFLRAFTWRRVIGWLRRKHPRANWKQLRRRYCQGQWWPKDGDTVLFDPGRFGTTRYRYRGAAIPTPWASVT
ncbi:GNAT family N-acetyltransferase [Streptomyces sp. NPDC059489]|uniref:GNAT family N-acetyltransferase n=1 Tax=Streptomyces sp. NPDC059489 TaxID=3346849 RepID=UPI00367EE650